MIEHLKAKTREGQEIPEKSEDVLLTREGWMASIKETKEGFKAEIQSREPMKNKKE